MSLIKITFDLESNQLQCPFVFDIVLDDNVAIAINGFDQPHFCEIDVADDEADHVLEVRMRGKTAEHTKINDAGEIIDDILVTVKNFRIDDIDLGHTFLEHTTYSHDFNGTQDLVTVPFVGVMGCNGIVKFKFSTPAYFWLLENL